MNPPRTHCQVVTDPKDVLAAWSLVHDVYVAHGHIDPQPEGLYLAPAALHRSALVFSAELDGELAATLTVMQDSELGLPPESGFGEELDQLRSEGAPLCFCGQFVSALPRADDSPRIRAARAELTLELFGMMAQSLASKNREVRLLANPVRRHVRYYARFLGFEQRGPIRTYGRYSVSSALMVTDWERLVGTAKLPEQLRAALERSPATAEPPVGITSATLSMPRMKAHVDALWGPTSAVWSQARQ